MPACYTFRLRMPRRGLLPICLVLGLATTSSLSRADVIVLKNGRKIFATVTREDSKQVFYALGEGEVALPRSLIDRIEKSATGDGGDVGDAGRGPDIAQGDRARRLAIPPPSGIETPPSSDSPLIKSGAVDEAYLRHVDDEFERNPSPENRNLLKRTYQEAAIFETRHGDAEAGLERYRHALRLVPNDLTLTLAIGYLLITQNHYLEARDVLLPASDRYAQSADLHMLLGSVFYGEENLDQAVAEWNKALAIADNPRLREAVAKARKEQAVSGSYQELRSEHFLVRYEGSVPEAFSGEVIKTLDAVFLDLERDLDFYPSEAIVVLLYPNQAFRDITRSPSWAGAVNDGKLRIPVSGLSVMTPEVARVLKHELTHSFVRQMTLGRCPTWLNEGLAQLEEGATTAGLGSQLARSFAAAPAYSALEGSFLDLPADQANLAYAKSLAALEYLRDTQGIGEIRRLLKSVSAHPGFNELLRNELRSSYPAFEQDVTAYVEKKYGSP